MVPCAQEGDVARPAPPPDQAPPALLAAHGMVYALEQVMLSPAEGVPWSLVASALERAYDAGLSGTEIAPVRTAGGIQWAEEEARRRETARREARLRAAGIPAADLNRHQAVTAYPAAWDMRGERALGHQPGD